MKHPTTCKFCRKPILLEIDDSYSQAGDMFKLIPFAACNHCADLRINRRRLEDKIRRFCGLLANFTATKRKDKAQSLRETLTKLTQDYAQLVASWHGMSGMAWEPEFVDMLLENPEKWAHILSHYWRTFKTYCKPA